MTSNGETKMNVNGKAVSKLLAPIKGDYDLVVFSGANGKVILKGIDMSQVMYFEADVGQGASEDLNIALPASYLAKALKSLGDEVNMEIKDNKVVFKSGRKRRTVTLTKYDDFPNVEVKYEEPAEVTLLAKDLIATVKDISESGSKDVTLSTGAGIVVVSGGDLYEVEDVIDATDSNGKEEKIAVGTEHLLKVLKAVTGYGATVIKLTVKKEMPVKIESEGGEVWFLLAPTA